MDSIKELSLRAAKEYPKSEQSDLGLRLRRATSWLLKASEEKYDLASQFIFCWIAFNAAYGVDTIAKFPAPIDEINQRKKFFEKIESLQQRFELHYLIKDDLKEQVDELLDNEYVFKMYWIYELGNKEYDDFTSALERDKRAFRAVSNNMKTAEMLIVLFFRLNTLRNQLFHGAATWKGSVNPPQVIRGAEIISRVVPKMIEIMMLGPDKDWSNPSYPPTFMLK